MGGCAGVSSQKLGIAYACVIGAALASMVGPLLMIFVPIKNKLFLAGSLSFAAGVMMYISIVDIYAGKAVGHFEDAGYSSASAFTYATICFFCGFPISYVLDKLAEYVVYPGHDHGSPAPQSSSGLPADADRFSAAGTTRHQDDNMVHQEGSSPLSTLPSPEKPAVDAELGICKGLPTAGEPIQPDDGAVALAMDDSSEEEEFKVKARKLVHMGLLAAMAMALHNIPEGLVTFVGYMDSVYSGVTTAIAIAIHNIPEGMIIASSVYFGTGNRLKAILWSALAAMAEPLGGLIGLAVVCGGSMTNVVFGILFGLVGGIMVYISLKHLLPSARSFDPEDRVTTGFLTMGMIVMACSLIAIAYSQPQEVPAAAVADADVVAVPSPPGVGA